MKKFLSLTALALTSAVLLTGCVTNNDATPEPTTTSTAIINPTEATPKELGIATFSNGVTVKAAQLGVGYATKDQDTLWDQVVDTEQSAPSDGGLPPVDPEMATATPSAVPVEGEAPITTGSQLVDGTKVVAISYEVTNTSSTPVDLKTFSIRNGYYEPQPIDGELAKYESSPQSLHSLLGVPSFPETFDEKSNEWILNGGESVVYALDWQIAEADLKKDSVVLSQNFSLGSLWASDNKFTLLLTDDSK